MAGLIKSVPANSWNNCGQFADVKESFNAGATPISSSKVGASGGGTEAGGVILVVTGTKAAIQKGRQRSMVKTVRITMQSLNSVEALPVSLPLK